MYNMNSKRENKLMGKDLLQTKLQQILQNNEMLISENSTCLGQGKVLNFARQVLFSDIDTSLFCRICCNLVCSKSLPFFNMLSFYK